MNQSEVYGTSLIEKGTDAGGKALRIIREEEGKQFDPDMAEVFIHIFREGKIHLAEPAELKREEKA